MTASGEMNDLEGAVASKDEEYVDYGTIGVAMKTRIPTAVDDPVGMKRGEVSSKVAADYV